MGSNQLILKPKQGKIFLDQARFLILVCGRRWGKTTLALLKLFTWAYAAFPYKGGTWGYFAPTYKQAKLIAWDILKQIVPPQYRIGTPNESDLRITLKNQHRIQLFGVDKAEHLFGMKLLGGVGDEFDQWKPGVYQSIVRPALSDSAGRFWFIGNPDSTKRRLKELYDAAGLRLKQNPNASWSRYHYKSIEGGYIPPEEIAAAKEELDERTFLEQYEASFLDLLGQVYYGFSENNVTVKDVKGMDVAYNTRLPIRLFWDFNVNPFCVGAAHFVSRTMYNDLGQPINYDDVHVFEEFIVRNSNTVEMAHLLMERFKNHVKGVVVYGDAAGKARHTSSTFSDYQIIMDVFKNVSGFQIRIKEANPVVKDRVNAVNSKLYSYSRRRHVFIHPRCKKLVRDFMNVTWKEGTTEIDKTDLELTHISDGFGYMCEYEFPVIRGYVR